MILFRSSRVLAFLTTLCCFSAKGDAQSLWLTDIADDPSVVQFPYNPDEDESGAIGAGDLLAFLIYFGNSVEMYQAEQELDPLSLQSVLSGMAELLIQQEAQIAFLQSQLDAQAEALASFQPLVSLIPVAQRSSFADQTWRLDSLNLQLANGTGSTHQTENGLGNLIVGYNEELGGHHAPDGTLQPGEARTGSHNVILGAGHTYAGSGAFLGGQNHASFGMGASVFSGQSSLATGSWSSILGGLDNRSLGIHSTISGGHSNLASGDRASVSGGLLNESAGVATSILGGQYLQIFEQYETASGQYNIND